MFQLIGNKRIKGRMSSPLQIHIRSSYSADETKNIQAVKKHEEHAAQTQAQRFPLDAEKTAQEQLEIENNVTNGALQALRLSVGSFAGCISILPGGTKGSSKRRCRLPDNRNNTTEC